MTPIGGIPAGIPVALVAGMQTPHNVTPDYPHVRASERCPIGGPSCGIVKPIGNVVCWPCYRRLDFRNGIDDAIERRLEQAEVGALY